MKNTMKWEKKIFVNYTLLINQEGKIPVDPKALVSSQSLFLWSQSIFLWLQSLKKWAASFYKDFVNQYWGMLLKTFVN